MTVVAEVSTRTSEIRNWLADRVAAAGAKGLVIGLSGGIDSAVVARLSQLACPDRVLGVIMPCHSNPQDELDALLVANAFGIPTIRVDLVPAFEVLRWTATQALLGQPELPLNGTAPSVHGNLKPRLRMTSLYFIANSLNYLVAGTGNRSECLMGYFTKYGDGGVDLLPIGNLFKSQVRDLAIELGVPVPVIRKAPSAGLWEAQTDESEMGVTYEQIEQFMADPSLLEAAVRARIEQLMSVAGHKLAMPPMPNA